MRVLRVKASARVLHAEAYAVSLIKLRPDHDLPRTILDALRRFGGVQEEIHHHLLELDTIASDSREVVGELRPKHDSVSLKLAQ